MMGFLQFLAVLMFGASLMFIALVGGVLFSIRLSPLSSQKGFDWLVHHITQFPSKPHPARLQVKPYVPFPSHVQERRILPNNTKVWINLDGHYYLGEVIGYSTDPTFGAYYTVRAPYLITLKGSNGTRCVKDTFIWEADEVAGDVVTTGEV